MASDLETLSEASGTVDEVDVDGSISGFSGGHSSSSKPFEVSAAELEARLRLEPPGFASSSRGGRGVTTLPGRVALGTAGHVQGLRPAPVPRQDPSPSPRDDRRRFHLLEETLVLKDRRIAELQSQVDSLRERRTDLARKVEIEQDVREQINSEIRGFQEKAHADLRQVRSNMAALHQKEVALLQERLTEAEERASRLQSRLNHEEQAHQTLQLAHQRLAAELQHEITEKVEKDYRLLLQDSEAHARRAQLLEETLALRDEKVAELQAKVDSLREKKKDLARKVELEQVNSTQEVRDQINAEIRRFQEKAQSDLESVRSNMTALHQKEVSLLQERVQSAEERLSGVQSRLENEEQAHQAHQLSFSRIRAELQNEITELSGSLKLKCFEIERAGFTLEEVSQSRQKLEAENEQLKKQMEVLRQEFYTLEVQYKEGRANERAELMTLREQMKGYMNLEKDLDATIKNCAEAPNVDAQDPWVAAGKTHGMFGREPAEEALLIGTTLGSAPASAQRRIQQSLLLAQELQKKNREAREAQVKLLEAEKENGRLKQDLEAAQLESRAAKCSEPQVYLHTALREQKAETQRLKRELRSCRVELDGAQQQAEKAQLAKLHVEEDLRKLLLQRQHLDELRSLMVEELPCKPLKTLTDSIKPERALLPA
ncbi:unnamed protein product [Durusdinium trenchii]|uniref:Uncharacterized protein n=1 Tax=Durusdinium trenchii TaxID=1381693 RepID=A0ABP0K155_9DINO